MNPFINNNLIKSKLKYEKNVYSDNDSDNCSNNGSDNDYKFESLNTDNIKTNNIINNNNKIEIWIESTGRKKNTFISGWNINNNELKNHLKYIKKKNGCNGTIKDISIDSIKKIVILLQGDHVDYIYNYLIQNGITNTDIYIKG